MNSSTEVNNSERLLSQVIDDDDNKTASDVNANNTTTSSCKDDDNVILDSFQLNFLLVALSLIGICGNSAVVYVTIVDKRNVDYTEESGCSYSIDVD